MSARSDLADVLRAIADGTPVDWSALDRSQDHVSQLVDGLKLIARIAEAHVEHHVPPVTHEDMPSTWGPFKVLERVGTGAYGTVYRAWDDRLNREVALKLLADSPDSRDSLLVQEGELLARVHHPNVVTVYGADCIDGQVGIWMEFVRGRTVQQMVQDDGPLSCAALVNVGVQIAAGLEVVHAAGIVHRDINAHNVLVQDDGRTVLMDFGAGLAAEHPHVTTVGAPLFIAPEVLAGGAATPKSDVYALGVLLYFMATTAFPFEAHSVGELRERLGGGRVALRHRRGGLSRRVVSAIEAACDPEPDRRLATAAAVAQRIGSGQRMPGRWLVYAATVAALVILGIAAFSWVNRRPSATVARSSAAADPLLSVHVRSEPARTAYTESVRLARLRQWGAAIVPAKRAVQIEPDFASGWIWLAWCVRNSALGGAPSDADTPERRAAAQAYQPYVVKAVSLSGSAPAWEQHWILGTAALFADDRLSALRHMGAVYKETGLDYALNNLSNTVRQIHLRASTPEVADAELAEAKKAIPPERWTQCCEWYEWSSVYVGWKTNRIDYVNARVQQSVDALRTSDAIPLPPAPYFALALGRLSDAATLMRRLTARSREQPGIVWAVLAIAEAREDEQAIRELSADLPRGGPSVRPSRLLIAGYVREVEQIVASPPPASPYARALFDVARGQLLIRSGHFADAEPLLRNGQYGLSDTGYPEYFEACAALAEGYAAHHDISNAIASVRQCTDRLPGYGPGEGQAIYGVWRWLTLRAELADWYRLNRRGDDADAIDRDLRLKLSYGERDVPLVRRVSD